MPPPIAYPYLASHTSYWHAIGPADGFKFPGPNPNFQLEARSWKREAGSRKPEAGSWKREAGSWERVIADFSKKEARHSEEPSAFRLVPRRRSSAPQASRRGDRR